MASVAVTLVFFLRYDLKSFFLIISFFVLLTTLIFFYLFSTIFLLFYYFLKKKNNSTSPPHYPPSFEQQCNYKQEQLLGHLVSSLSSFPDKTTRRRATQASCWHARQIDTSCCWYVQESLMTGLSWWLI